MSEQSISIEIQQKFEHVKLSVECDRHYETVSIYKTEEGGILDGFEISIEQGHELIKMLRAAIEVKI